MPIQITFQGRSRIEAAPPRRDTRTQPRYKPCLDPPGPGYGKSHPHSQKEIVVKVFAGLLCLGLALAAPALAEDMDMKSMDHMDHMTMGATSAESSPSTKAFEAANEKMHKDMSMSFTGDADVDFVKGMIPHHQGAIDMAKVELQYGKDPEIRKLAEDIIKAQETEIAFMNAWLAKHAKQ